MQRTYRFSNGSKSRNTYRMQDLVDGTTHSDDDVATAMNCTSLTPPSHEEITAWLPRWQTLVQLGFITPIVIDHAYYGRRSVDGLTTYGLCRAFGQIDYLAREWDKVRCLMVLMEETAARYAPIPEAVGNARPSSTNTWPTETQCDETNSP